MRLDCYTVTPNTTKNLYHTASMSYLGLPVNSNLYTIFNSINSAFQTLSISIVNDKNYVHDQALPSTTWNVAHMLGKFPSVTIIDTSGNEVIGDVNHIDINNVIITHSASFAGKAFFN